jgi:hypothetical protein
LGADTPNVRLFISHAKADLAATDEAAKKIHSFVVSDTTGKAFFGVNDLRPGESLDAQLDHRPGRAQIRTGLRNRNPSYRLIPQGEPLAHVNVRISLGRQIDVQYFAGKGSLFQDLWEL